MRSLGISVISIALTTVVIANAYYQKKQFYPSVVYITKSNPSMAVIYIQAFICVLLAGKLMRKIFFGELRTSEFEHLMERSWYAITETCLAFTVFRDDFNPKFVALFTLLLFLKSFHWLAEDRVDFMERSPIISYLFHIRVLALLLALGALDLHFVEHAYQSTVSKGASVQLVFGFEYAILITMVINVAIKYSLYSVDMNSETPWDNKAVFLLYTELIMGLIKVILYVAFVVIMVKIYTLPLFALRPMYYTIRNFKKAFNDVILSRRAIHNMNTLYPDATLEELQAGDNVCIICREEMTTASKKLPCNHIFHASCLRSWFQRQQTCPTCRLNILRSPTANANERQEPRPRPAPVPNVQMPNQFNFNMPNPFILLNANLRNAAQQQQQQQRIPPVNPFGMPDAAPPAAPGDANHPNPPMPNLPGFFPFTHMPMPFMAVPPMAPPSLSAMTTEQLRRLEGNERDNVEARIQWLRNIQLMLDAGILMFQQYNTAAALTMAMPNMHVTPTTTASTTQAEATTATTTTNETTPATAGPSTSTLPTASETNPSTSGTTTTTTPEAAAAAPSAVETPASSKSEQLNGVTSTVTSSTNDNDANENENTPEAEVRRRRLQKFLQGEQQQ